jgi:hypothetical protein
VRENQRGKQEWTIQRHKQHWVQDAERINVRENQRGKQEWTIQRHKQHWVQDAKRRETKQKSAIQKTKTRYSQNKVHTQRKQALLLTSHL